jgi:glyoxylase I family protein
VIRGIHHVALNTHDLERLVTFYNDVVGFEVVHRGQWAGNPVVDEIIGVPQSASRWAMLKAGNCYLEIFQYSSPPAREAAPLRPNDRGYTHLCLDVTDMALEYRRLSVNGMVFAAPYADFGDLKAVYGKDPDGNVVEIQETTNDQTFALARLKHLTFD